jgi:hypothetical protein
VLKSPPIANLQNVMCNADNMNNTEKVIFPFVPVGEWTITRPFTSPGLFVYRHLQALDLLDFPDFGDGDMTREQRREALDRHVNLQRPLTAIVIFLNVVALEDFIRDFGMRLSNIETLDTYFPNISALRLTPQRPNPDKPSKQLDKDPAPLMDFEKLNELYSSSIGVSPINITDFPRLYDLTIIRHCIAHNGSMIREVDLPRFQYYSIIANHVINPPTDFVKETCSFLYKTGRHYEHSIRDIIFETVIKSLNTDWDETKPQILLDLIQLFNFFGKIPTSPNIFSEDREVRERDNENKFNELIDSCLKDLSEHYKK